MREAHFEKLDKACYLWFLQQRSKGAPVSGPELKEKALHVLYRVIVDNYSELRAPHRFTLPGLGRFDCIL